MKNQRQPFSKSTIQVAKKVFSDERIKYQELRLGFISLWSVNNNLIDVLTKIQSGELTPDEQSKLIDEQIKSIPTQYNVPLEIRVPYKLRGNTYESTFTNSSTIMPVEGYTNWDEYKSEDDNG